MSIETKDNTKEVLSALDKAVERGLEAIGLTAEGHAKKNETAVDTGLLRNSITYAVSGKSANTKAYKSDDGSKSGTYEGQAPEEKDKAVYIGTNVEYAPYIELGTKGRQGLHFLQRSATEHSAEYKRLLEDSMKNA
jgi:hypothetical protein